MQKKDTTTQKAGAPRKVKTIRQRAQAIIDNKRRYDSDTREAIFNAMVKKHADLADCVKRAERGETILDLTSEEALANVERLQGIPTLAAHISAVLTHPDTPAVMYNALADGVNSLEQPRKYFDGAAYIELCLRENAKAAREAEREGLDARAVV
jgi:hypothetical protein